MRIGRGQQGVDRNLWQGGSDMLQGNSPEARDLRQMRHLGCGLQRRNKGRYRLLKPEALEHKQPCFAKSVSVNRQRDKLLPLTRESPAGKSATHLVTRFAPLVVGYAVLQFYCICLNTCLNTVD
jgi:hypothetical protein